VSVAKEDGGKSKVATGWGKSLQIVNGHWSLGPTWVQMSLSVPSAKQDWSTYKQFGFYWNTQQCIAQNIGAFVPLFLDKDGEYWGWKVPAEKSWSFVFPDNAGNIELKWVNSDWGGVGHGDWYGDYITIKLDETLFERKGDNEAGNGNNIFDTDKITSVLLQIDMGPGGVREGDILYLDDFFLAKSVNIVSNKYMVDGVDFAGRNEGMESSSSLSSSSSSLSSSSVSASQASSAASNIDSSSAESAESENSVAESSSAGSDSTNDSGSAESSGEDVSDTNSTDDPKDPFGSVGLIIAIVIAVLALAGGLTYFFVIKPKRK